MLHCRKPTRRGDPPAAFEQRRIPMSAMTTYSPAYDAAACDKSVPKRNGLLQRFLDRMVAARMRKAEEFIRQHSHLIPRELEERAAWKITDRSEDSLPFVR